MKFRNLIIILGLLLSSCVDYREIPISESFAVQDTIQITIPHYNVGAFCYPEETYTFVDNDTIHLDYFYYKRYINFKIKKNDR
tara:strand:+ start:498 stop:746 length:249 start_codon:yes stop_codon:yes gene_type:complete